MGGWISYVVEEKYVLFSLFVNMNVSVGSVLVCFAVIKSAFNSSLRILGYPIRQATILTCIGPLRTLIVAILFFLVHPVVLSHPYGRIGREENLGGYLMLRLGGGELLAGWVGGEEGFGL